MSAATAKDVAKALRHHPVLLELGRAKAALWLLDQVLVGELSFLEQSGSRLPTWSTAPLRLDGGEVHGWLLDIGVKVIAQAIADAEAEFLKAPVPEAAR